MKQNNKKVAIYMAAAAIFAATSVNVSEAELSAAYRVALADMAE